MIQFFDVKNNFYLALATLKRETGVNGSLSLSGEIYDGLEVIKNIDYGWGLIFEGERYIVTFKKLNDQTNTVEFDAVQQFFWDFSKQALHEEISGSHTFDNYLSRLFQDTNYTVESSVSVPAFEKDNWGYKNKLELFNDIIQQANVEFSVSNTKVKIKNQIGSDLLGIVRYGINLSDMTEEMDISEFATYGKGYGAFKDENDHSKGRLEAEYRSELAITYGDLEINPIVDERYTKEDNLKLAIKEAIEATYKLSISANVYDLQNAGYPRYQSPAVGDWILAIDENLDFKKKIRIVKLEEEFDATGKRISYIATCGDLSVADQYQNSLGNNNDRLDNIENQVDNVMSSANGKNSNYYGPNEPHNPIEGDLWYSTKNEDPDDWVIYQWHEGRWEQITLNPNEVQDAIENATDGMKDSIDTANKTAKQAQDDATNALDNLTVIDNKVTELSSSVTEQINTLTDGYQQILVNENGLSNKITNITGILDTKVASDQYETDRLQTDKIISDVVKDVAGNATQINQLSDNINLMVQKDDIINQINISTEGILIDGQKVHITGQTVIDNAVIKDAMIGSVSADKLTAGTINANLINVVNLNGANIMANTITGDKMTADAIQVGFQRMGSNIRISPTELSFWNGGNRSLSLQKDGMHIIDSNNAEDVGLIHTNHLVGHPEYNGLNFDLNAKGDYMAWGSRASNDDNYDTRLAWVRAGMASNTNFSAGLNIVDQVTFGKGIHVEGVPALMNFKKVTFNGGTYPYLGNDNIKAGFLYGTTQIYMSSDGIAYNLTKVIKALAGLSGKYSLITSFEKNSAGKDTGVAKTWTYVTF